jgi:TusA-related sulfurtransferase
MSNASQELIEIDIRGQICPSCLLTTLREVNQRQAELKAGEVSLRVKTDSRDATSTIPAAVGNMGYPVTVEKREGYYLILIDGRPRQGAAQAGAEVACPISGLGP